MTPPPRPGILYILLLASALLFGCGKAESPAPAPAPAPSSLGPNGAEGPDRIALLIGNNKYPGHWKLDNPGNDAEDYGAALQRAGFRVEVKTDLDQDAMLETVRAFGERAKSIRGVALFYFAGHGMELDGRNFLLPVNIKSDMDNLSLSMKGLDADRVVKLLGDASGRINIAIFDMCRNRPGRGLRGDGEGGLARMDAAKGSLLAFATRFGAKARDGDGQRNSPYAKHLIAKLDTPNLSVTDYFNFVRQGVREDTGDAQIPEETSRLEGLAPPLLPGAAKPAPVAQAGESAEVVFWNSVKDSGKAEELKLYLERYPQGQFAALARGRAKSLEAVATTPAAPAAPVAVSPAPSIAGRQVFRDCGECPEMVAIPGKDYALGKTEVTQGQWKAVMGSNPSHFSQCGDDCPVENVSWDDAQAYIKKLNEKTGKGYRLPQESEWRFACHGGGSAKEYCGGDKIEAEAWYSGNSGGKTQPVGRKVANGFGLYDMSGNVMEWMEDCLEGNCSRSVLRGGSWDNLPLYARSASRNWLSRASRGSSLGFRLARMLP